LSRFDLCFILVDTPDDVLDEHLSHHVLAPHGRGGAPRLREAQQKLLAYHAHRDDDDDDGAGGSARKRARDDEDGAALDDAANRAYTQRSNRGGDASGLDRVSLRRRLRLDLAGADEAFAPLPRGLMRKYISYAVAYCHPRLTAEASDVLKAFYLELRARADAGADGTPITPRQLESLIRLAEARAKVELRERVTADDARDAVEIMKESMRDVL
jgi:DNA helicase MCM8